MGASRQAMLALLLAAAAAGAPAGVWAYIVVVQLRTPQTFHDQGGMIITLVLFPVAMLAAMGLGVAAMAVAAPCLGGFGETRGDRWAAVAAIALSLGGFGLALTTCVGPQMLAEAIR